MKLPRLSLSAPDLSNFKIDIFGFLDGKIQNRYFWIFGFNITHLTHRTIYQCVSYHYSISLTLHTEQPISVFVIIIKYHSLHTQNNLSVC